MAVKVYNEGDGLRIDDGNKNVLSKFSIGRDGDNFTFADRYGSIDFSGIAYSDIQGKNGNSVGASADEVQSYIDNQILLSETSGIANASTRGVFGELVTAHKTPIVQIDNKYQIDPDNLDNIEIFEATGGSADNSGNLFRCQSGTSVGGYGVVRSVETLNYLAGQGVEAMITASFTTGIANSLQFAGMFTLTETIAFGYDGADFSVIHSYGGVAEVQLLTVTASGTGTTTVTLDGDGVGIATDAGDSLQTTAEKLRAGLVADATLSVKWRFEQVDDKVYCIAKAAVNKTGAMTVTGDSTVSIAEQTAGVSKTDNHTAQSSWNITTAPFDGFDPTKLNVYKVQFGYLGIANILFSIYDPNDGVFVPVHQVEWANANTITHLGNPNMKVGWTSASLGSSGTNLTVTGASASIMIQGDDRIKNNTFAAENSVSSVATTITNILTIKNRTVYGDRFNLGKIIPLTVAVNNDHNKGCIVEIYRNATLVGTTNYQYEDEFNSLALIDKSGTALTGGTLIDAFTVEAGGSANVELDLLFTEILPDSTFTVAAKTISGTSTAITAAATWKEIK